MKLSEVAEIAKAVKEPRSKDEISDSWRRTNNVSAAGWTAAFGGTAAVASAAKHKNFRGTTIYGAPRGSTINTAGRVFVRDRNPSTVKTKFNRKTGVYDSKPSRMSFKVNNDAKAGLFSGEFREMNRVSGRPMSAGRKIYGFKAGRNIVAGTPKGLALRGIGNAATIAGLSAVAGAGAHRQKLKQEMASRVKIDRAEKRKARLAAMNQA